MKNYDEMYRRVIERRDEHLKQKRKRMIVVKRAFPAAAGFCFLVLLGFSLKFNKNDLTPHPAIVEDSLQSTTTESQEQTEYHNTVVITTTGTSSVNTDVQKTTTNTAAKTEIPVSTEIPKPEINAPPSTSDAAVNETTSVPEAITTTKSANGTTRSETKTKTKNNTSPPIKTTTTSRNIHSAVSTTSTFRSNTMGPNDNINHCTTTSAINIDPPDPPQPTDLSIKYSDYYDLSNRLLGFHSQDLVDKTGLVSQWEADILKEFLYKRNQEKAVKIPYYNGHPAELRGTSDTDSATDGNAIILNADDLFSETWITYYLPSDNIEEFIKIWYLRGDELKPEILIDYDSSYETSLNIQDRTVNAVIGQNSDDPRIYVNFAYDDILAVVCISEERFNSGYLEKFCFQNLQLR